MKIRISSKAIENLDQPEKLTISIPKAVMDEADRMDDFIDPMRPRPVKRGRRNAIQLQIALNNVLEKVIASVRDNELAYIFVQAVTEKVAPGYFSVVSRPMHFQLIWKNCRDGSYADVDALMKDVDQIVENCYAYNRDRNPYLLPLVDQVKDLVLSTLEEVCSLDFNSLTNQSP